MLGLPPLPARIERELVLGKAFALGTAILLLALGFCAGAAATRFVN